MLARHQKGRSSRKNAAAYLPEAKIKSTARIAGMILPAAVMIGTRDGKLSQKVLQPFQIISGSFRETVLLNP
jgi:hypothetical protein